MEKVWYQIMVRAVVNDRPKRYDFTCFGGRALDAGKCELFFLSSKLILT